MKPQVVHLFPKIKKPSLAGTGDSRGTTQISQSSGSLDAKDCMKITTVHFPDNAGRAAQLTHEGPIFS